MAEKLSVFGNVHYDEAVDNDSLHTYQPYGSNTYGYSDEINIVIQSQDLITDISESFLYIEGVIKCAEEGKTFNLSNNFACFLFEEMRYILGNVKCDVCRVPGITSAIKGYASYTKAESDALVPAGWQPGNDTLQVEKTVSPKEKRFSASIPLKHVFGFAEDYNHAIVNMRQELILIRARTDLDCYHGDTDKATITLSKIHWKVPHIIPSDAAKLELFENINRSSLISIPFRQWELYELPALKQAKSDTWAIKTSTQLEKPRFVLLAFQKNKRNIHTAKAADFSDVNITNLKLYLNSERFPYENWNLDFTDKKYILGYEGYARFPKLYHGNKCQPLLNYTDFAERPIFLIDCSRQKETMKTSTVDIKVEMESLANFSTDIMVYCLILHDTIVEYSPLTGEVRKL